MIQDIRTLLGSRLSAKDGDIGSIKDIFFDDHLWHMRYAAVDTGTWLPGKKVLVSPVSFCEPQVWDSGAVDVDLTRKQVTNRPEISDHLPVSRQKEEELAEQYRWQLFWVLNAAVNTAIPITSTHRDGDPFLRSVNEVVDYSIAAEDGEIGHVETFLLDFSNWRICYMVVDTKNWLPGKKVLVSPAWVKRFIWEERKAVVSITKELIERSPEYDPSEPLSRQAEEDLYGHYSRPAYWL